MAWHAYAFKPCLAVRSYCDRYYHVGCLSQYRSILSDINLASQLFLFLFISSEALGGGGKFAVARGETKELTPWR